MSEDSEAEDQQQSTETFSFSSMAEESTSLSSIAEESSSHPSKVEESSSHSMAEGSFSLSSMAEKSSEVDHPDSPPFLEVTCKSTGKIRRFAAGSKAGFAVSLINRTLDIGMSLALNIEAFRNGEEPISFGPDAVLVNFGNGWKLQTVIDSDYGGVRKAEGVLLIPKLFPTVANSGGPDQMKKGGRTGISSMYIAKILLAFILMFVLGGIFTFGLENLPRLILLINSSF
ncbi:hypothetical protein HS088_TW04G01113 [Tripterygium wilfordii]|uniref:Uncharacterized protein n=1 Tax=Tripterygium wilfordii TaxID=458696 RepID=A0A7J7DS12_TRIWF|nr:uncharacterized protein LOC119997563 [Tripterygium wilfordii]KAF5749150.1 hypothetical protein HS088_TW04G01113 [Tripterygium wilfordii]